MAAAVDPAAALAALRARRAAAATATPLLHLLDALRIEFARNDAILNAEARKKIDDPGYGKELEDGPDSRYEYWP